jgi:hypothetical protein
MGYLLSLSGLADLVSLFFSTSFFFLPYRFFVYFGFFRFVSLASASITLLLRRSGAFEP